MILSIALPTGASLRLLRAEGAHRPASTPAKHGENVVTGCRDVVARQRGNGITPATADTGRIDRPAMHGDVIHPVHNLCIPCDRAILPFWSLR